MSMYSSKHKALSLGIPDTWIKFFRFWRLSLSVKNAGWYWKFLIPTIHKVFTESQFSYSCVTALKILGKELVLCYMKGLIVVFFRLDNCFKKMYELFLLNAYYFGISQ
jgi:hypothetical protein